MIKTNPRFNARRMVLSSQIHMDLLRHNYFKSLLKKNISENPHRGSYPKELLSLGIREFHEIFFKPYRIVFRITENKVYILLIADGRRDMQKLLRRRLLQP